MLSDPRPPSLRSSPLNPEDADPSCGLDLDQSRPFCTGFGPHSQPAPQGDRPSEPCLLLASTTEHTKEKKPPELHCLGF